MEIIINSWFVNLGLAFSRSNNLLVPCVLIACALFAVYLGLKGNKRGN
jgi:hypothetical protein